MNAPADKLAVMSRHYTDGHAAGDVEGECRSLERLLELLATAEADARWPAFTLASFVRDGLAELVRRHGEALVLAEVKRRPELVPFMPPSGRLHVTTPGLPS